MLLLGAAGLASAFAAASPPANAPRMPEVPKASAYLTERLASGWLRARVRPGPANEHIPTVWSQCVYHGVGVKSRRVGFVFKFMLWEMFDVASLDPKQLEFNVTFAAGGIPPREKRTDVGTMAFGFEKREETILLVITGFQGPRDGAGRPTALIATYSLSDPETAHDVRLATLVDEAQRQLKAWHARP